MKNGSPPNDLGQSDTHLLEGGNDCGIFGEPWKADRDKAQRTGDHHILGCWGGRWAQLSSLECNLSARGHWRGFGMEVMGPG